MWGICRLGAQLKGLGLQDSRVANGCQSLVQDTGAIPSLSTPEPR